MAVKARKIFSQLYDQYINKIYRFIFLKVNSQEIAEDLTSETFLRFWKAFKQGKDYNPPAALPPMRAPIENPQAFLYQIARNLVIDFYRQKSQTKIISAEYQEITDPRVNLEEKAVFNSDLEIIRQTLTNLKEDYQTVIIWHYLDDLSIPEIAKNLNKSEEAVRVTLHRALKSLREKIKND